MHYTNAQCRMLHFRNWKWEKDKVLCLTSYPACRNSSQRDGSGLENSGPGSPRRRCLHHGPQGCCCHAGLCSWCHGGLSTSHSWSQTGSDFPRRRWESAEAGAGETGWDGSRAGSLFSAFSARQVTISAAGLKAHLVFVSDNNSSVIKLTPSSVTAKTILQDSAGCHNKNLLAVPQLMRLLCTSTDSLVAGIFSCCNLIISTLSQFIQGHPYESNTVF